MSYAAQRPKVERGTLERGHRGTWQTLAIMSRLARAGADEPEVRAMAHLVVTRAGVLNRDPVAELRALHRFVSDRVRFTRDPAGIEQLQTPGYTLRSLAGDCDDKSILLAGMIRALGVPLSALKFRVIGARKGSDQFTHVLVVAYIGALRYALDATRETTPFGWEPHTATVSAEVDV